MEQGRTWFMASLTGLAAGIALAVLGVLLAATTGSGLSWFVAHGITLVFAFLLPAFYFLTVHTVLPLLPDATGWDASRERAVMALSGGIILGIGHLVQPSGVFAIVALGGALMVTVAGVLQTVAVMQVLPARGVSVVDTERDPLTKGDDACLKQVKLAHMFLPLGLLMLLWTYIPFAWTFQVTMGLRLAGYHVLLIGYGLLMVYAIGHIVVPRFSGVPAIAAGAIKGELHSTMTGLLLLTLGFIFSWPEAVLILAGGFVFVGFFTYMGVLGANIMKRKSQTHRVTREFVYIPWTFTGIFWLISGVVMGMFLTVVPDTLSQHAPALRFLHVHVNLYGGITMLWLGWNYRLLATWTGREPPRFESTRWAFYILNAALVAIVVGRFQDSPGGAWMLAGAGLSSVGLAWYLWTLKGYMPGRPTVPV